MSYDVNKAVERFEEEFASGSKENIYVDGKAESFKAFLCTELERCVSETTGSVAIATNIEDQYQQVREEERHELADYLEKIKLEYLNYPLLVHMLTDVQKNLRSGLVLSEPLPYIADTSLRDKLQALKPPTHAEEKETV